MTLPAVLAYLEQALRQGFLLDALLLARQAQSLLQPHPDPLLLAQYYLAHAAMQLLASQPVLAQPSLENAKRCVSALADSLPDKFTLSNTLLLLCFRSGVKPPIDEQQYLQESAARGEDGLCYHLVLARFCLARKNQAKAMLHLAQVANLAPSEREQVQYILALSLFFVLAAKEGSSTALQILQMLSQWCGRHESHPVLNQVSLNVLRGVSIIRQLGNGKQQAARLVSANTQFQAVLRRKGQRTDLQNLLLLKLDNPKMTAGGRQDLQQLMEEAAGLGLIQKHGWVASTVRLMLAKHSVQFDRRRTAQLLLDIPPEVLIVGKMHSEVDRIKSQIDRRSAAEQSNKVEQKVQMRLEEKELQFEDQLMSRKRRLQLRTAKKVPIQQSKPIPKVSQTKQVNQVLETSMDQLLPKQQVQEQLPAQRPEKPQQPAAQQPVEVKEQRCCRCQVY